jgi:hypothetical protein
LKRKNKQDLRNFYETRLKKQVKITAQKLCGLKFFVSILIYCVSSYRFIEIGVLVVRMSITISYPGASRLSPIKKLEWFFVEFPQTALLIKLEKTLNDSKPFHSFVCEYLLYYIHGDP